MKISSYADFSAKRLTINGKIVSRKKRRRCGFIASMAIKFTNACVDATSQMTRARYSTSSKIMCDYAFGNERTPLREEFWRIPLRKNACLRNSGEAYY